MKTRREIDPELHILRSAVRAADGRDRQYIESARFNLYEAFDQGSEPDARRWAKALRAAIMACDDARLGPLKTAALEALADIEQAIEG